MYGICFAILIGLFEFAFTDNGLGYIWMSATKFLFWWYVVTSVIIIGFIFLAKKIIDIAERVVWLKSLTDTRISERALRTMNKTGIPVYPTLIRCGFIVSGAYILSKWDITQGNYVLFACGTIMLALSFVFPRIFMKIYNETKN